MNKMAYQRSTTIPAGKECEACREPGSVRTARSSSRVNRRNLKLRWQQSMRLPPKGNGIASSKSASGRAIV